MTDAHHAKPSSRRVRTELQSFLKRGPSSVLNSPAFFLRTAGEALLGRGTMTLEGIRMSLVSESGVLRLCLEVK